MTGGETSIDNSSTARSVDDSKEIARSGVIASSAMVFGKVMNFLLNLLLSRALGLSSYGLYAIARSIVSILKPFTHIGLENGVVRYGSMYFGGEEYQRFADIVYATFLLSLGSSVIFGLGLYSSAGFLAQVVFSTEGLMPVIQLFSVLLPIYVMTSVVASSFQAVRRITYQQFLTRVLRPTLDILTVFFLFAMGYQLQGVLTGLLLSGIATLVIGAYLFIRHFPVVFRSRIPDVNQVTVLLRYSLPLVFVSASYTIALRTDRLMLGIFENSATVGVYNAAAVIAIQIGIVHTGLISIFSPVISDLDSKGATDEIESHYNMVKRWAVFGAGLLALPILFYPSSIMSLFGSEFVYGWPLLTVLTVGPILGAAAGPTGTFLKMTGNERIEFVNATFLIVSNVALNLLLIPFFGVVGAASATILSQIGMNVLQIFQIRAKYGFTPVTGRLLVFLSIVAVALITGFAANLYLTFVPRTIGFLVAVVGFLLLGYAGHTPKDRQIFQEVLMARVTD